MKCGNSQYTIWYVPDPWVMLGLQERHVGDIGTFGIKVYVLQINKQRLCGMLCGLSYCRSQSPTRHNQEGNFRSLPKIGMFPIKLHLKKCGIDMVLLFSFSNCQVHSLKHTSFFNILKLIMKNRAGFFVDWFNQENISWSVPPLTINLSSFIHLAKGFASRHDWIQQNHPEEVSAEATAAGSCEKTWHNCHLVN